LLCFRAVYLVCCYDWMISGGKRTTFSIITLILTPLIKSIQKCTHKTFVSWPLWRSSWYAFPSCVPLCCCLFVCSFVRPLILFVLTQAHLFICFLFIYLFLHAGPTSWNPS
jgi:hypothetical protein